MQATPDANNPLATGDRTIRPRIAVWTKVRTQTGLISDAKLARQLGVTQPTITRTMNGTTSPSPKFIAHALTAFPAASFDQLFEVVRS